MTQVIKVHRSGNSCYIKIPKNLLSLTCFSNKRVNFVGRSDFSIRLAKCKYDKVDYPDSRILSGVNLYIPKDLCRIFDISFNDELLIYSDNNKDCFIKKI